MAFARFAPTPGRRRKSSYVAVLRVTGSCAEAGARGGEAADGPVSVGAGSGRDTDAGGRAAMAAGPCDPPSTGAALAACGRVVRAIEPAALLPTSASSSRPAAT